MSTCPDTRDTVLTSCRNRSCRPPAGACTGARQAQADVLTRPVGCDPRGTGCLGPRQEFTRPLAPGCKASCVPSVRQQLRWPATDRGAACPGVALRPHSQRDIPAARSGHFKRSEIWLSLWALLIFENMSKRVCGQEVVLGQPGVCPKAHPAWLTAVSRRTRTPTHCLMLLTA